MESLVWVTVGKTQHPAILLESGETTSRVRWTSNGACEWVSDSQIHLQLASSRSRRTRPVHYAESSDDGGSSESTSEEAAALQEKEEEGALKTKSVEVVELDTDSDDEVEVLLTIQPLAKKLKTNSPTKKEALQTKKVVREPPMEEKVPASEARSILATDRKSSPPRASAVSLPSDPPLPGLPSEETTTFAPGSSAYLQNLAEICHTVMRDARWRVGSKPLFRWELGDDLGAVLPLSRRYRRPRIERHHTCRCLLCRDVEPQVSELIATAIEPEVDEELDRALYLYARLFYRKGPWFRLDDIYNRYYAPKRTRPAANTEPPKNESISHLSQKSTSQIDERLLQEHYRQMELMLRDMRRLRDMGLWRPFETEEECGKVVGRTLLKGDERERVLILLGGGTRNGNRKSGDNAIWKQMNRQRPIFATKEKSVLPVRKHVDKTLTERMGRYVVQHCYGEEYVSAPVMRSQVDVVTNRMRSLARNIFGQDHVAVAFCLREAPLSTLRRCARLYLCATGGPGDMRSSPTNGWKSLRHVEAFAPHRRAVPLPGLDSWSSVVFPGLSRRFGLSTYNFQHAFKPLELADPSGGEESFEVFRSDASFEAWEMGVELRSHLDYLIELNEMIRYMGRKRQKQNSEDHHEDAEVSIDSVDFLGMLSAEGRLAILSVFARSMILSDAMLQELAGSIEDRVSKMEGPFDRESERIIVITGILCVSILELRMCRKLSGDDTTEVGSRPWLRHMRWEGSLAYLLWDIIPIFERLDLYAEAVRSLQVLLFGRGTVDYAIDLSESGVVHCLLSRRARGKALDRLVIDRNHLSRLAKKRLEAEGATLAPESSSVDGAQSFCQALLHTLVPSCRVSFSGLRLLARRLKAPLASTMSGITCPEAEMLGLRYGSASAEMSSKYSDWEPQTDRSIANALPGTEGRCAFVGHEEAAHGDSSSLNVEELAMEYYRTGRLPETSEDKGGWTGWHDEGGHLRALFRILVSAPLLGMDWGCPHESPSLCHSIYLTPYQGAPFDLHVGYQDPGDSGTGRGFYRQRRERIEAFLTKLANMAPSEISCYVRDCVISRVKFLVEHDRKDPSVHQDLGNLRTLSMLAAACSGRLLAMAFRCLTFDYRHYSGGLPDLTLVRAVFDDDEGGLVDLGEWIGEAFDPERRQSLAAEAGAAMLADDEFLGCSKVGDSGGRPRTSNRRLPSRAQPFRATVPCLDDIPDMLVFEHKGRRVKAECMFVEVKSANDRLDPRQEDWLNILDQHGNARVCKFEAKKVRK